MADPTDLAGVAPPLSVALVLAFSGIVTGLGSAWLNRRPGKRRTEPAPSPTDQLDLGTRVTIVERNLADAHQAYESLLREHVDLAATVKADGVVTRGRLDRLERREWPTT